MPAGCSAPPLPRKLGLAPGMEVAPLGGAVDDPALPDGLPEDVIRAAVRPLGFVDVKVCAVSDLWSGLRLVVRKERRAAR